jgi:oligoendopeptidase F
MRQFAFALLVSVAIPAMALGDDTPAASTDDSKNPAYMWDLSDLYPSPEAWTAAHDKLGADVAGLDKLKGTLGKSPASMLAGLSAISHARKDTDRLNVYASLKGDEDVRIAANQERQQLAMALMTALSEKTAWLTPEILALGAKRVHAFEAKSPDLARKFGSTIRCATLRTRSPRSPKRSSRPRDRCCSSRTISTASSRTASCPFRP